MGLLENLGLRAKAPKAPAKPKRRRRTNAQIHSDEIKAIREEAEFLKAKAELDRLKHRIKSNSYDDGSDGSWSGVVRDVLPDLVKVFAGNLSQLTQRQPAPTADAPVQIPETTGPQPGDDQMDTYSKAILPHVRGKSPEDAAAWLRAAGKSDPVMGKAVIGRLVATPEAKLPALLNDYEAFAPAFIQYCRINYEWFLRTVRCLKPPTNIAPVDPIASAL